MVAKLSMSSYAKPSCNMLVFYDKHVWYWNKNILYFVIYMLYNRYIFPIERSMLKTKWLADLN